MPSGIKNNKALCKRTLTSAVTWRCQPRNTEKLLLACMTLEVLLKINPPQLPFHASLFFETLPSGLGEMTQSLRALDNSCKRPKFSSWRSSQAAAHIRVCIRRSRKVDTPSGLCRHLLCIHQRHTYVCIIKHTVFKNATCLETPVRFNFKSHPGFVRGLGHEWGLPSPVSLRKFPKRIN